MEENLLKGKRVLVTGGCGFIGSHITDRLVNLGAEVVVLDNLLTGKIENISGCIDKVDFVKADIRDSAVLDKILPKVDFICHQAALRSVPKSVNLPWLYHEVNVSAALQMFIKAKDLGIKRIVFASSSSVYGEREDFPEKEDDLPRPVSPYACTKLQVETYAYMFWRLYGLEIVSLRYFNVFGPRQSLENEYAVVVPKFIVSLLKQQSPPIYGDGRQERDFTYIDNVVEANIRALTRENIGGEVFNVALGRPYSVNSLLAALKNITGSNIEPVYLPPRLGDVRKTYADTGKLKNVLGVKGQIGFEEGLAKTVEWFKNNYQGR